MRAFLLSAALLVGCSSSNFSVSEPVEDGSLPDTSGADVVEHDTGRSDSGTTDTATADSGKSDSGTIDTGTPSDGGPVDTGSLDTGSLDTGSLDTGSLDTGSFDTGPLDGGPACPAPPSTSMPSGVDSLTCEEIKTKLPAAVADAKRCNCDADCSKEVWRDACKCTTFVNPGQEATPLVIALMKRWSDKLCTTICPLAACPAPTKATCVPDPGGGSFKVCKDG